MKSNKDEIVFRKMTDTLEVSVIKQFRYLC